jgi:hypothetical protein
VIGILTFHRAYNYGAQLQAYALQKTIEKLGYECEFIDYRNIGEMDVRIYEGRNPKAIIKSITNILLSIPDVPLRYYRFKSFAREYLRFSINKFKDRNQLHNECLNYEKVLTGSDQVWNPNITICDLVYFLDFEKDKCKKIAYAPSFGVNEISDEFKRKIKVLIEDISNLSIREIQGQKIIKDLCGVNVPLVLDPTLLISNQEWDSIAAKSKYSSPYILCYALEDQPRMMELCYHIHNITGYRIIKVGKLIDKLNPNIHSVYSSGTKEFVRLIKDSSIVVTNSYHGTVMSINYQKPFYTIPTGGELIAERNSRLVSVLSQLELSHRLFLKDSELPELNQISVDYKNAFEILESAKEFSLNFLKDSFNKI